MPLSCNFRAVCLFGQRPHLCSFPAQSASSRAQRSSTNLGSSMHRCRTSGRVNLDACFVPEGRAFSIMHVMIRCDLMGSPGGSKRRANVSSAASRTCVTQATQYELQTNSMVRSVQERKAGPSILGPRAGVFSNHMRTLRLAQRLAQMGGRCKALPRFEGDSAPCVTAADHGCCDRADINFVDVGTAMPPAILCAIVATAMVRPGRQHGWSGVRLSAQRQSLDRPSTEGSAGDPRARDWQTSGVRSAGSPTAPLQSGGLFLARSAAWRLQ